MYKCIRIYVEVYYGMSSHIRVLQIFGIHVHMCKCISDVQVY